MYLFITIYGDSSKNEFVNGDSGVVYESGKGCTYYVVPEMQKGWTAEDAKGFIKVSSTPLRVYYGMHPDEKR